MVEVNNIDCFGIGAPPLGSLNRDTTMWNPVEESGREKTYTLAEKIFVKRGKISDN